MLLALWASVAAQSAIGEWQNHNSYISVRKVCATSDRVYAATRMSLFYYDRELNAATPMTLSSVGVSTMAYSDELGCLVVAYNNSGVDLVMGGNVFHVADIRYGSISGDKKIYSIRFSGRRAYLATGFGIVVLDVDRHEVAETYYIGENGEGCLVYDVAFTDSLIWAGTDRGLLFAPRYSPRLHIYETWALDTVAPVRGMSVRMLETTRSRLVAAACTDNPDSMTLFYQRGTASWGSWGTGKVRTLRSHNGYIVVNRQDRIELYNEDYSPAGVIPSLPYYGLIVSDADIDADGTLWLGHAWGGLLRLPQPYDDAHGIAPDGPVTDDYVYSITATDSKVYVCPGGKKPTYESALLPGSLSILENNQWSQVSRGEVTAEFQDVLHMAVDPKDRRHISATAWGYGVLDIHNNVLQTIYNQDNSDGALIPYTNNDFVHLRVGLAVRYRDGSWQSFDISPLLQGLAPDKREIDKLVWDSVTGYKWFIGKGNRIYVHDGVGKQAIVNPNNGSKLETHNVNCLVQDRSGDIWFGTDKGIKVIYDGYRAFLNGGNGETSPVNCSNILYNEDGINEYLMAYESINCIAVDGANRKWVGTSNNGLYLISANGLEQLHHFTAANSPLASDKIVALAVHPESGVVYVATDMGLQSYRSTATVAYSEPAADIHAFPNPVRPEYEGTIAVKGFTRDALVHITDARGHVVFSTTAHGGQAVWNGRTHNGDRVSSGTYFVFASDASGNMRSVTKILIIR